MKITKEQKINQLEAMAQYYADKSAKFRKEAEWIRDRDLIIHEWVRNDPGMRRKWNGATNLHEMFLSFMGLEENKISKVMFGRLLTESGIFKRRNGREGKEWKLKG